MLIINLNSIKSDREHYVTDLPGHLFNPPDEIVFRDSVHIDLQIYRTGEQVVIKGQAETKAVLSCSRCLEEFEEELAAPLFFIAVSERDRYESSSETNGADDPSVIFCKSDQLDLEPEVRSALLLALPMKPLCKESCLGLCPRCGKLLDDKPCQCSSADNGTPFGALEQLLNKKEMK